MLAADDPAAMLVGAVRSVSVSEVADPARLRDLLVSHRPRLVVCGRPPASLSDLAAHELRRRGDVLHLRPKEFGLLALLTSHPGRAYTRAEILDSV